MILSSIRQRLLELYLAELRSRERLTGADRITLYRQFQRVLELDQLLKEEAVNGPGSEGRRMDVVCPPPRPPELPPSGDFWTDLYYVHNP